MATTQATQELERTWRGMREAVREVTRSLCDYSERVARGPRVVASGRPYGAGEYGADVYGGPTDPLTAAQARYADATRNAASWAAAYGEALRALARARDLERNAEPA